jgi:hypothetical protein
LPLTRRAAAARAGRERRARLATPHATFDKQIRHVDASDMNGAMMPPLVSRAVLLRALAFDQTDVAIFAARR